MEEKLKEIERRFAEVNELMTSQEVMADIKRMTELSKEFKDLKAIMEAWERQKTLKSNLENARALMAEEEDPEMREMAELEVAELEPQLEALEEEIKQLLIPKDPEDRKNAILEIRAGTGGDEASLFAGDLYRMYKRYAERHGWQTEITEATEGTSGGYKEIIVSIAGEDVFGTMKFESGVHRVQRVPETETQGRVHTSAATVAVMPEVEEVDVELQEKDLRIDRFCASGNGGQSVNTTYSAVRLTHIPTGVVVSMQNERSQLKNLALAKKIMAARLYELEMNKRKSAEAKLRKSLVSTGDRSAKIRTYNFPQSRVTDHRINKTVYNLQNILDGELDEFIESLRIAENAERLAAGTPQTAEATAS